MHMNAVIALFVTNFLSKSFENAYEKVQMIDILLKYFLCYEFSKDLDAYSDFEKKNVTKKLVKWN